MLTHIYLFFCMTKKYLDSALFVFQNEQLSLAQFSGYFFHQSLILHDATMKFNLKNYMRCSYITLQIEHSWLIEQRDLCFSFFSFLVSFPFLFPRESRISLSYSVAVSFLYGEGGGAPLGIAAEHWLLKRIILKPEASRTF